MITYEVGYSIFVLVPSFLTPNPFFPSLTEEDALTPSKSSPSSGSLVPPHLLEALLITFSVSQLQTLRLSISFPSVNKHLPVLRKLKTNISFPPLLSPEATGVPTAFSLTHSGNGLLCCRYCTFLDPSSSLCVV